MNNKIIKLKPRTEPKDGLALITSVATLLGDIDDQISQHFEDQGKD